MYHPTVTQIAGVSIELIAAIIGLSVFKKAGAIFRLLALFLVFGFLTDMFCWQFRYRFPIAFNAVLDFYTLVESVFFIYLISLAPFMQRFKKIISIIYFLMPLLFAITYFIAPYFLHNSEPYSGFFSFVYLSTVSAFAALAILKLTETGLTITTSPHFFLLLGVFIFCFCSFFIDTFINDTLRDTIWWIHDVANIIAYLLFIKAFLTIKPQPQKP